MDDSDESPRAPGRAAFRPPSAATVEPLPFVAMGNFPYDEAVEQYPDSQEHRLYRKIYNTRTMPGDGADRRQEERNRRRAGGRPADR
jgi:hypothetical protein